MGNQVTTPESGGNVPAVNLTGTGTTASSSSAHSAAPGGPIQYTLSIKTGNIDDAGTNANVYVILIGENGSESGLLRLPAKDVQGKKYFQKGQTDVISVTGPDVGEVRKVRVGHDNKGFGAGWFLDSITVKSPKMNDETNFVCRRWLDKKQDDGQIIREIIASKSSSGKSSLASYKITVKTGDVAGAGTDANVFICIFGDKGDTGNRVLTSQKNAFERNQVDIFNIEAEDVGVLKKIRIGHDNKGIGASWFLESVTITNEKRGTWTFPCNKWFDKEHDDKQLVRDVYTDEQQATATETMYTITVVTGNLRGAGTNSKVTVNIFGEKGETGERSLENARDNFARGKTDTFDISAMELGDLRKLRIGHDGTGIGSDWLLDGVKVRNERTGKEWAFPCGKWLSNSMENCSSVTELVSSDSEFGSSVTNYRITVKTGDLRGSGTDADVFIQIYGENGDTGDRPLDNSANNFERGRIDVFGVESVDLGELKKIRIGHNGAGFGAGWFLDWVTVRNEKTTKEWKFPCGRWLAVDEDDKLIVRDLEPSDAAVTGRVMYKVEVLTGNRRGAGTDANVHMEMYGARGKSGIRVLDNADNNFERNQTDTFNIDCMDLGDLTKIRIGHDNSGFGGAWFLDKVIITNTSSDERYFFNCNRWLAKDEDDGLIERELPAEKEGQPAIPLLTYKVTVVTGDRRGAGTSAKVFVQIYGTKGDSGKRKLEGKEKSFKRNSTDTFGIECVDLGQITKIRVGHDNGGFAPGFFLDKIIINEETTNTESFFLHGRWLAKDEDDGEIEREIPASNKDGQTYAPLTYYKVTTVTGDRRGAGTDANVYVILYGENGDSGKRKLEGPGNLFERAQSDVFGFECVELGPIKKITIGHDGSGFGSGWFLDKVVVQSFSLKKDFYFMCGRWLDKSEDDGLIERDLDAQDADGVASEPLVRYKVAVTTGERRGAGTDANVFIQVYGKKGQTKEIGLDNPQNNFEAGKTDMFGFESADLGDLTKLRVWHDNSGFGASWFLDKIVITNMDTQADTFFLCGRWLSKDEEDGQITRELPASNKDGQTYAPMINYKVSVITGNIRGAGTDANVFITLFGDSGDSGKVKLSNQKNNFEKGQTDVFNVQCVDLGTLSKVLIEHDGTGFGAGWFLDKIIVNGKGQQYYFLCGRWLDKAEDDGLIARELIASEQDGQSWNPPVTYTVTVVTGDRRGAGTSAGVYINLYGKTTNSGEKKLEGLKNPFQRNQTDQFGVETVDLGDLTKIRVWTDNKGFFSAWFLDKIIVESEKTQEKWFFNCGKWLAKNEDDGLIERELPAEKEGADPIPILNYKVSVVTGDRRGAGTSAKVFITIYGKNGDTGKRFLEKDKAFQRNITDDFGVESVDLGELTKIRIGHDNGGFVPGWFLDKVTITEESSGKSWYFLCGKWLAKDEDDGSIERELPAKDKDGVSCLPMGFYQITTVTANRRGAGTDANVYITVFGENGDSGKRKLEGPGNLFERGRSDTFGFECVELGAISRIAIGHDGSGVGSGWFLDKVIVKSISLKKEWYFLCGKWLDKGEDDGKIERELVASEQDGVASKPLVRYNVAVTTGDRRGAGTDANVYIQVYGSKGKTKEIHLDNPQNNFERAKTDVFGFESEDLGDLTKLRVWHDNAGFGASWFLEKIVITNMDDNKETFFLCGKWLAKDEDDKKIERELPASDKDGQASLPLVNYTVSVITGDRKGAGTDANVYVWIYGANGDSGQQFLDKPGNCFERNQTDDFGLELVDLGDLVKLRVGHDNKGIGASWFLDKIIVTNETTKKKYYFLCGRWLAKDEEDGLIERELPARGEDGVTCLPMAYYRVTTVTGNRRGAGTDADVFVTIFGENGDTGPRKLEAAKKPFQKGQTDYFGIEAVDIGAVKKIKIGHNGSGPGDGWFVEKVIVKSETLGKEWFFLLGRWLAKDEEDGQIEVEMEPKDQDGQASLPVNTYRVTVITGDRPGAGTDANVFITIYGKNGDSGSVKLEGPRNCFERNKTDIFEIESVDLGEIKKIRIGHDNSKLGASWFLEKVMVTSLATDVTYYFLSGKWLSKDEDDKQIEREIAASLEDGVASQPLTKYSVFVKTGDIKGAGTDANVFVYLYGTEGESGRRLLDGPGNLFEKGQTDNFGFESVDLGDLTKLRIGHDDTGFGSDWFLESVTVKNENTSQEWKFPCNHWFAKKKEDGKIERDLFVNGEAGPGAATYKIVVITGNVRGAGTDADVHITIVGDKGKIDKMLLSNDKDNFEKGHCDIFGTSTTDLGDIKNITISQNGRGFGSAWFLDKVFIINETTSQRWIFPCNRWLAKREDDGKTERTLFPGDGLTTTYNIKVKTGLEKGAGTDANVYLYITGEAGKSDKLELKNSLTNVNKFERGQLDIFNIDCKDVGKISKIDIGHDNAGLGASWYLDCVEITNYATGQETFFPCKMWFDKSKDDKKIERELAATEKTGEIVDEYIEEEEEAPKDEKSGAFSGLKASLGIGKKEEKTAPVAAVDPNFKGGVLTVQVLSGRNLQSKDSNGLSDPYCEISLVDEKGEFNKKGKKKTKVIKKSLNPTWNESFQFETVPKTTALQINMYDEDMVGEDEFMGQVNILPSEFTNAAEQWITLKPRNSKDEVKGDIQIKLSFKQ